HRDRRGLAVRRRHHPVFGQPLRALAHRASVARRDHPTRRAGVPRGLGGAGMGGVVASLTPQRCAWAAGTAAMIRYHDREWGVPQHDDKRLFELLILEGAQAGLSWSTILAKREAYRRAFARFDPRAVARFTAARVRVLLRDEGIVRNRAKILATVVNARAF